MTFKFYSLKKLEISYFDENIDISNIYFINNKIKLKIINITYEENRVLIYFENEINIKYPLYLNTNNINIDVPYYSLYTTEDFNKKYYYPGDLGVHYETTYSEFTFWSPSALKVSLKIYKETSDNIPIILSSNELEENNNIWYLKYYGDLKGYLYTYEVTHADRCNEIVDPYAKAVSVNGHYGAIVDLRDSNPTGFLNDSTIKGHYNPTDAIIYEISIRDMTTYPKTDIINKGKYLGLCQLKDSNGYRLDCGISHIIDLGVTHVQLMPIFDFSFSSVDELMPRKKYNWGYDPQNYNVPEGSYATNPKDPLCRIKELKTLIQTLHSNNLYVIMDVVFNHIFNYETSNLELSFPGYYFRRYDNGFICNGSGCGNDIATERPMVRKFIIDSLKYWVNEYHIDGFRFDLMGLIDVNTMNEIYKNLKELNENVFIYGEGWNLSTNLSEDDKTILKNNYKTPSISYFNDFFRDTFRGSVFFSDDIGFIAGKNHIDHLAIKAITGSDHIFSSPCQNINYLCCHDNHTFWDKLSLSAKFVDEETRIDMFKLGIGILLLSQGIPFFQSGLEFLRTKDSLGNTYNSPDYINWIDWDRKYKYYNIYLYTRNLIRLRRNHKAFRFSSFENLKNHMYILENVPHNVVGYKIYGNGNGDTWSEILVIFNSNDTIIRLPISSGPWILVANKHFVDEKSTKVINNVIEIDKFSFVLLYK